MSYKFEVGEPVVVNHPPKNTWRLHVYVMCGDADHFENKHSDFADVEELTKHFALMDAVCRMSHNDGCHSKKVWAILEAEGERQDIERDRVHDWYCDVVGRDVSGFDDQLASPESTWVTFFDENGVEHKVTVNDKKGCDRTRPVVP